MGITERREREREEVRQKILDAARELFATEGYEKVTMRRIADAIEYSPTTFAQLLALFKGQLPPDDPVEWIRQLGNSYCRFGLENPNHYRFMFMTRAKFEKVPEASPSGQDSFGVLKMAVEAAIASGRFRPGDPQLIAQVLWSSIHGAVALLITMQPEHWPHGGASPSLVDEVVENGIRGFLAAPRKD